MMEDLSKRKMVITAAEGLSYLDSVIFNREDWDMMSPAESLHLRLLAISDSVRYHATNCRDYNYFCAIKGFDPFIALQPDTLKDVPQIPTSIYKLKDLISVPIDESVKRFESSGTSGTKSRIFRDEISLARLSGSLRGSSNVWSDILDNLDIEEDVKVIHLGPTRKEAGTLWFSNVMGLIELEADTTHVMRNSRINWDEVRGLIIDFLKNSKRLLIVGAPFLVEELCQSVKSNEINAKEKMYFITGGGWKKFSGNKVSQTKLSEIAKIKFGLKSKSQFRDVFNQVELNSAFVECSHGRLHSPPWVEIIVRNPYTLNPVESGNEGLLSYLDPTAHSFPCFFIGEDVGTKEETPCKCGRKTPSIQILRRLKISAQQGCSLQLAKDMHSDHFLKRKIDYGN
jgi:long-chain-fatty-acid---luciferin-component ligase